MHLLKRGVQVLMLPLLVGVASVGLGLLAICGAGPWKVLKHVMRNIVILTPRLPTLIKKIIEQPVPQDESLPKYCYIALMVVGSPFIVMLIVLDDFE